MVATASEDKFGTPEKATMAHFEAADEKHEHAAVADDQLAVGERKEKVRLESEADVWLTAAKPVHAYALHYCQCVRFLLRVSPSRADVLLGEG
jgi:hypothetical protein